MNLLSKLFPQAEAEVLKKQQAAQALLAEADAAIEEKNQIASQWNSDTENLKKLRERIATLKTMLASCRGALPQYYEAILERGGGEYEALDPLAIASKIAATEAGFPIVEKAIATLEQRHAAALESLRAFVRKHKVPRDAWPEDFSASP